MGKSKPKMEVTEYYMSVHYGICSGPIDALLGVTVKEKTAWTGVQTEPGAFAVSNKNLFGGVKKEGGIDGLVTYLPGRSDQVLPDFHAARLGRGTGANCPGYRGLASLFFTGTQPSTGGGSSGIPIGGGPGTILTIFGVVLTTVVGKVSGRRPGFYWTANSPYLPGVWATVRRKPVGLDPSLALVSALSPVEPVDPYAANVILLMGFEGADGSTSFVDQSPSPVTMTAVGAAQIDTAQKRYGSSSLLTPTAADHVSTPGSSRFDMDGDFTVECWVRHSADGNSYYVGWDQGSGYFPFVLMNESNSLRGYMRCRATAPGSIGYPVYCFETTEEGPPEVGKWRHIVFERSGTTLRIYRHGIMVAKTTGVMDPMDLPFGSTGTIKVGQMVGWMDKVRITKGIARYASDDGYPIDTADDANPAHMIYECLTNTDWGMGAPSTIIDVTSFEAAATALYDEEFGLSMMWTRQAAVEDFISEILDHIQAVLFVDPATGLLTLKLIRDDYDPDTLPVLTPHNADVTKFDRKLWGEIINEIIVTWTNPQNEQEETVTVQDLASVAMQGGNIVSASRNYYGVRNADLATQLGRRDLRTVGAPLCSAEVEIDRSAYALRPASVVKLTWPEHGLDEVIMRVMSIDYGRPGDMTIRATLMEDVFSLDAGAYVDPVGSEWEDPSSAPEPITEARVITLPAFLAADAIASNGGSEPVYPEVVAGILATTADTDTFSYELNTELPLPDGSLQWTAIGENNIIGRGTLVAPLPAEAATSGMTVANFTGQTSPAQGGFALIGDSTDHETVMEVAMVTAFDSSTGEFSLARGVMDTVPRAWAAGTHIWFVDGETLFEDRQVRSAGETVEYKLLSQTSQGQLALASAPLLTGNMTERPWLPLRPANVTAYGEAWSSEAALIDARARPNPWVTVNWSNRNRLTEDSQILLWDDATVTPEAGQTTTIEVRDPDDVVLTTHDGLSGASFDIPDSSFGGEAIVKLRVYSERDGFESLQFFDHWVWVAPLTFDSTRITFDSDTWTMDQD